MFTSEFARDGLSRTWERVLSAGACEGNCGIGGVVHVGLPTESDTGVGVWQSHDDVSGTTSGVEFGFGDCEPGSHAGVADPSTKRCACEWTGSDTFMCRR